MIQCKECGIEYEVEVRGFCSEKCFKINIQKRIKDATENDTSHTNNLTKEES